MDPRPARVVSLLVSAFLYGCALTPSPAPVPKPVPTPVLETPSQQTPQVYKIGLLLPLSGEHAPLGKALQQAAELSLFEHGADNLEIVVEDTQASKAGGTTAAQRVLNQGAHILLGPLFSDAVVGASEVATQNKVPLISFSNNTAVARGGVYVMGFDPTQQLERVLRFASQKALKRITAYLPQSPDGHLAKDVLDRLQKEGVCEVANTVFYDPNSPGTLHVNTPPSTQAILIPEGGQALSRIMSALLYHDQNVNRYQFFGSGQWDSPSTWAQPLLVGGWFAAPNPGGRATFEKTFMETYGYKPPRLATLSYDAVCLVTALLRKFPKNPLAPEMLQRPQGFMGIDGGFRLKAKGVVERSLALLEVRPHLFQVIDPAPLAFER